MSTQTRQALLDSIEKWRKNESVIDLSEAKVSGGDCPLCRLFVLSTHSCEGCPVYNSSKRRMCYGTPFVQALDALYDMNLSEFKKHAQRERVFLESLLPRD